MVYTMTKPCPICKQQLTKQKPTETVVCICGQHVWQVSTAPIVNALSYGRDTRNHNKQECPKSSRITGILGFLLRQPERSQLASPGAFGHIELHGLPFLQALEAACLNSGEMHKDIRSSSFNPVSHVR
jgi:hypothetical protein